MPTRVAAARAGSRRGAVLLGLAACLLGAEPSFADARAAGPDRPSATADPRPRRPACACLPPNVLSYAPGIAINDGHVHLVGDAPPGSPFHGVATLAGLAAITLDGARPFWWLTDPGARVGPLCTPGHRSNCFVDPHGAYRLTDRDVPQLDVAWLAIEAALMNRQAYLPAVLATAPNNAGYEIGSHRALPLMVPMTPEADANNLVLGVRMQGEGPRSSVIFAASSFGTLGDHETVIPLLVCGDPAATPSNHLGRWAGNDGQCSSDIGDLGLWGSQALAQGWSSPYRTDGIAIGPRMRTNNVTASWFYHDATIVGDHVLEKQLHLDQGVYGLLWPRINRALVGDLQFQDLAISGQSIAAMVVDGGATVEGEFAGETYLNAHGYDFDGLADGCSAIIGGATFENLMTEFQGLGVAEDEHNFDPRTGRYDDRAKCRSIVDLRVRRWFTVYTNDQFPDAAGRLRRATFDVASISGAIENISVDGGSPYPVPGPSGATGIAIFNVNGIGAGAGGTGFSLEGPLVGHLFRLGTGIGSGGATIPVFSPQACPAGGACNITWHELGGASGIVTPFVAAGTRRETAIGDVLEFDASGGSAPAGLAAAAPVTGVAVQGGLTDGMLVPVQTEGDVAVRVGAAVAVGGEETKDPGIGAVRFAGGTGGRPGTYDLVATGSCTPRPAFRMTVGSAGSIERVERLDDARVRCGSAPILTVPGKAGLSGARIEVDWPSAQAIGATGASPRDDAFGFALAGIRGAGRTGTQLTRLRLR